MAYVAGVYNDVIHGKALKFVSLVLCEISQKANIL